MGCGGARLCVCRALAKADARNTLRRAAGWRVGGGVGGASAAGAWTFQVWVGIGKATNGRMFKEERAGGL